VQVILVILPISFVKIPPAPKPKIDQGDISLDDLVADWEGK